MDTTDAVRRLRLVQRAAGVGYDGGPWVELALELDGEEVSVVRIELPTPPATPA